MTHCFNPCFNGTMYKNRDSVHTQWRNSHVSILVLMELCIKTINIADDLAIFTNVSILVLMELCIKTIDDLIKILDAFMFQSLF